MCANEKIGQDASLRSSSLPIQKVSFAGKKSRGSRNLHEIQFQFLQQFIDVRFVIDIVAKSPRKQSH